MVAIDLGDRSTPAPGPAARRPFDRRLLRRMTVALASVACVLAVTGSVRPEPRMLRPLWTMHLANFVYFDFTVDTLVLQTSVPDEVTAYDLADGSVRWKAALALPHPWIGAPDVVLLSAGTAVRAVGESTGNDVWRTSGEVVHISPGTVLFMDPAPQPGAARLRYLRTRDGSELWSRWMRGAEVSFVTRFADRLVTATLEGEVEVLRLRDGHRLSGGQIPEDADGGSPIGGHDSRTLTDLVVDDKMLYVRRVATGPAMSISAYDQATLRLRWRINNANLRQASACGPVVCVSEGDATIARDPFTGAPRWQVLGWTDPVAIGPDRLLGASGDGRRHAVITTAGEVVADLGVGFVVAELLDPAGEAVYDLADLPGSELPVLTPKFYLRDTTSPPGRTAVHRIDPRTGELSPRGTIEAVVHDACETIDDRLMCLTVDGGLSVTAVS